MRPIKGYKTLLAFLLISLSTTFTTLATAQNKPLITLAEVVDGDTIPKFLIKEVRVYSHRRFKNKRQYVRYTRLVMNVKKALPYAKKLSAEFNTLNDSLNLLSSASDRKEYLKRKEKELFKKFEEPLKNLTIKQGRILIKLIDRQTGETAFEIIKELKGGFKAFWWQGIARLFGSNLKQTYDAKLEDAEIENIVILIEEGKL